MTGYEWSFLAMSGRTTDLTRKEAWVLAVLGSFMGKDGGECYPSLSTIDGRARMGRGKLSATLRSLEEKGALRVVRSVKNTREVNRYEISEEWFRGGTSSAQCGSEAELVPTPELVPKHGPNGSEAELGVVPKQGGSGSDVGTLRNQKKLIEEEKKPSSPPMPVFHVVEDIFANQDPELKQIIEAKVVKPKRVQKDLAPKIQPSADFTRWENLSDEQVSKWKGMFSHRNVEQELMNLLAWVDSKRPAYTDWKRFIVNCLSKPAKNFDGPPRNGASYGQRGNGKAAPLPAFDPGGWDGGFTEEEIARVKAEEKAFVERQERIAAAKAGKGPMPVDELPY